MNHPALFVPIIIAGAFVFIDPIGGQSEESLHPILFRVPFFGWPLHSYGVLIVIGFLLAMWVAWNEAERQGQFVDDVLDFAFWALVGGMIGARVVFIIVNWRDYAADPIKILQFWKGGLVFYGSALGGFAAFLWFVRTRKLNLTRSLFLADIIIPSIPVAHAFGRLGCMAAGCCWGQSAYHLDDAGHAVADIPLAAQFPEGSLAYTSLLRTESEQVASMMREVSTTMPLFPSQLLESFGVLCIFIVLLLIRSRKWFHGQVLLSYAMLYPILRFTLEYFRGDKERGVAFLSTSQFISLGMALAALVAIIVLRRKGMAQTEPSEESSA